MNNYIIVTGLCGSGKTTYVNNLGVKSLHYDELYNYNTSTLNYDKINKFLNDNDNGTIYLDAYDENLIDFLRKRNPQSTFSCILLYIDLDNYHEIIAIKDPRNFTNDFTYDGYVKGFILTINQICTNINKIGCKTTYKYRTVDNKYIDYENDEHLTTILNTSKKDRLLKYIDDISGHSTYQSIMLNGEYIRKGTESDWITFDNILKCTSLKDKVVCDTGCFNGYFSFRSIKEGTKRVIGVDHNKPAINICNKLCLYNNYHHWNLGKMKDVSCPDGISFHLKKIGVDNIFDIADVDIIFALNYLHHLKNELGNDIFLSTVDSFFKNSKEVIFEINDVETDPIHQIAIKNNFNMANKLESHRKTQFGNRWVIHYKKYSISK